MTNMMWMGNKKHFVDTFPTGGGGAKNTIFFLNFDFQFLVFVAFFYIFPAFLEFEFGGGG